MAEYPHIEWCQAELYWGMVRSGLDGEGCVAGSALAAVDGGFGAPLFGEAADCLVDVVREAEEVADYALVEVGAVRVGVGEVCGHEVAVAEVVEYVLCGGELVVGEGAEVEDGEGFGCTNAYDCTARLLSIRMPPK